MREPRLAGERKPRAAKTSTATAITTSWVPVPTMLESRIGIVEGGRNTSACTSFHPVSSRSSSSSSAVGTRLYLGTGGLAGGGGSGVCAQRCRTSEHPCTRCGS